MHSIQLRRLYEHVKGRQGVAGFYGIKNIDEFVAEVFTNPDFQNALRGINAPSGSVLKTAWDAMVRIMRSILGLSNDAHSALSHALSLGVGVVREDMLLRKKGVAAQGEAFMRHPGFSAAVDAAVKAGTSGEAAGRSHVEIGTLPQALSAAGVPAGDLKTSAKVLQKVVFDHGVPPSVVKRIPELLEKPVMVFRSATVEGSFVAVTSEMVRGAPLVVAISPEAVTGGVTLNFVPSLYPREDLQAIQRWLNATKAGEQLLTYLDKEQSPAWFGSTRLQLPGEFRTMQGLQRHSVATQADIGNSGEAGSDPQDPDIRHFGVDDFASNIGAWQAPEESKFDTLAYKLQDKQIDNKRGLRPSRPRASRWSMRWPDRYPLPFSFCVSAALAFLVNSRLG